MYNNYNRIQCKKIRRDSKTSNIGIKQEKCKMQNTKKQISNRKSILVDFKPREIWDSKQEKYGIQNKKNMGFKTRGIQDSTVNKINIRFKIGNKYASKQEKSELKTRQL